MKDLPEHVTKVSEKWYYNAKGKRYIHADNIEKWLETYYLYQGKRKDAVKAKINYNQNVKMAQSRWFDKED